jgi:hypothetical protein
MLGARVNGRRSSSYTADFVPFAAASPERRRDFGL